jgi:transcriptional regulator with XRE-family HTH domain
MPSEMEEKRKRAEFAERVRIRLAALGWSQTDLARRARMSKQAMSQMINHGPYLTYTTLEKLAGLLEVKVVWLMDGDPREAVPEPVQPILEPFDTGGST